MSSLLTCVRELRRWHEQKHRFPNYPGWPTARQTDEEDLHLKARSKTVIISVFACKLKALANSKESYPLADRLAVLAVDSINSTCTYYSTVNKRMRLLTSLYGNSE